MHYYIPLPYPWNIIVSLISLVIVVVFLIIYLVRYKKEHMTGEPTTVTLYYSPSCGHCKAFRGTWNKFAKYLHNNMSDKVKVEEVDCSNGDCQQIEGVPIILLHRSNNDVVRYVGDRSYDNLVDFINKNC